MISDEELQEWKRTLDSIHNIRIQANRPRDEDILDLASRLIDEVERLRKLESFVQVLVGQAKRVHGEGDYAHYSLGSVSGSVLREIREVFLVPKGQADG